MTPALSSQGRDLQSCSCSLPAGCSLCQALNALPVSQSVAVQGLAHLLKAWLSRCMRRCCGLLTASVGKLSAHQLATYLRATLQHSRKSRKCVVKTSCLSNICLLLKAHSSKLCIPQCSFPCCSVLWQARVSAGRYAQAARGAILTEGPRLPCCA